MESFSQHQEDLWILENLKLPEKGFFLECGAYDGIKSSNTYLLEQRGWDGLCIEADPLTAAACAKNRKRTICGALGNSDRFREFVVNEADRGLSVLGKPESATGYLVHEMRLDSLIHQMRLPRFDVLSIDTEGTEADVWKGMGMYRYDGTMKPSVVIIEWFTLGHPSNEEAIMDMMQRDGYKVVHKTGCNLIFVTR